jgi:MoCo/4Fe-4S cofactor protein with predicted Tat translocation signal
MKMFSPSPSEAETGRRYWTSLDQLADTPEFRLWAEREFPMSVGELADPLSRRHFMKIMSASFMLAGIGLAGAGCRRPVRKIYPFARMPEHYFYGVPEHYATAMPTRVGAEPLVVKSNDGRPTKVEGNAAHPDSNGGTTLFAQGSILELYDPDRARRFTHAGNDVTVAAAKDFLDSLVKVSGAGGGKGLCFLLDRNTSPSRARLQQLLSHKYPQARWFTHEPVDFDIHARMASLAVGKPVTPYWRLDQARVILSLDCDFLGAEADTHRLIAGFAKGRKLARPGDQISRLYVVESLLSLTGVSADHRLRMPAGAVPGIAARLAAEVMRQAAPAGSAELATALARFSLPAGVKPTWITECAKDLVANAGAALVVAGYGQPAAVHLIANAMNAALGSFGKTIQFHPASEAAGLGGLEELAQSLNAGEVETLVIAGPNPVYTAPADLDWATTQRKAKTVVRLGYYEDETFPVCDWHFPLAHYLESWGDARTSDGTLVSVQPLIEPLFGGWTELELLGRLAGLASAEGYGIVRETFKTFAPPGDFEEHWKQFLHDGFLPGTAAQAVDARMDWARAAQALAAAPGAGLPSKDNLEIIFRRDLKMDDGRHNNNGWMQELPEPVTKLSWDNAVLISRRTASELGLRNTEIVEVTLGSRTVRGPIWVQPGQADYSLGLALGYGRSRSGRVGQGVGYNAYRLRTRAAQNLAVGATIHGTGRTYSLSCTQDHWSMEGRPIVREADWQQFQRQPDFARRENFEEPPSVKPLYPNPLKPVEKSALYEWGLSVDLNSCVGCSACVTACQSENNIPIVGKVQVGKGREMFWMRIDRYYSANPALEKDKHTQRRDPQQWRDRWIDDPQAVNQPMLCQQCEAAPCENVCPVNATVHNDAGINVMVYNRCVGTRYCSNNCPYKVRRFNFFDYNKRPLDKLYRSPLDPFYRTDGEWELLRWLKNPDQSNRPSDAIELMKMVHNPDVTVRMRGVMEKCNYCLQRIERAKIARKIQARESGDVVVPDGVIQTACQQVCPAEAIVFGNLKDSNSRVSRLKQQTRDYSVLGILGTRPRTTYLARVRNPNPAMPDYYPTPMSTLEFLKKYEPEDENEPVGGRVKSAPAPAREERAHG